MAATRTTRQPQPQQPEIRELHVDDERVYEALDRQRRHLRMRYREVAQLLGVSPASISAWGHGGGLSPDALARACIWLEADLRDFVA